MCLWSWHPRRVQNAFRLVDVKQTCHRTDEWARSDTASLWINHSAIAAGTFWNWFSSLSPLAAVGSVHWKERFTETFYYPRLGYGAFRARPDYSTLTAFGNTRRRLFGWQPFAHHSTEFAENVEEVAMFQHRADWMHGAKFVSRHWSAASVKLQYQRRGLYARDKLSQWSIEGGESIPVQEHFSGHNHRFVETVPSNSRNESFR